MKFILREIVVLVFLSVFKLQLSTACLRGSASLTLNANINCEPLHCKPQLPIGLPAFCNSVAAPISLSQFTAQHEPIGCSIPSPNLAPINFPAPVQKCSGQAPSVTIPNIILALLPPKTQSAVPNSPYIPSRFVPSYIPTNGFTPNGAAFANGCYQPPIEVPAPQTISCGIAREQPAAQPSVTIPNIIAALLPPKTSCCTGSSACSASIPDYR